MTVGEASSDIISSADGVSQYEYAFFNIMHWYCIVHWSETFNTNECVIIISLIMYLIMN